MPFGGCTLTSRHTVAAIILFRLTCRSSKHRRASAPYLQGIASRNIGSRGHTMSQLCPRQERTSIRRRALLTGGIAGVIGCAFPPAAHAATAFAVPTAAANRRFSVLYKGFGIGSHTLSYSS